MKNVFEIEPNQRAGPLLPQDNDRWDERGGAASGALLSWKDLRIRGGFDIFL